MLPTVFSTLALSFGFLDPPGQHRRGVVRGELPIRVVEHHLALRGMLEHPGLQVVRDQPAWDTAENEVILVNGLKASDRAVPSRPWPEPSCGTLMPRLGASSSPWRSRLRVTPASTASWHVNGTRAISAGSGRGVFTRP